MKRHSVTGNKAEVIASKGSLIIVGGREDKQKDRVILREIARRTGTGKLIVATLASEVSGDLWKDYRDVFTDLGVKHIEHLHFENHEEARHPKYKAMFHNAKTVFFTGGDQLKITTKIGGTDIVDWIQDIYLNGGTIAGTSAGASVMGKIMLMGGENQESHKVGQWMMSPGLGLLPDMIIDQHFAQRGRIGRLLGAVAPNPGLIGVGIDEDTAIIVEKNHLRVIGTNAVYIVDARNVTYTNLSEAAAENTMAMHNVQLHILAEDHVFDLKTHRPRLDQVERVHG
ncbi:cyanophycinase [Bdellovibrio sp. HCB2-146]|uniref:cyanophycinase n=1 Tax=Bdellovibrio sp. HCB2-146 TaxID=3394362 RepID=UPI0039BC838F